jgi:hypothetical protein
MARKLPNLMAQPDLFQDGGSVIADTSKGPYPGPYSMVGRAGDLSANRLL